MRFNNILLVIIAGLVLSMTSCSTTEKFAVYAPAGTKIYTPYNASIPRGGAIASEKTEVTVPSDMYCGYILAQPEGSNQRIPVGLDYKSSHHLGTKAALYTGITVAGAGAGTGIIGCAAMLAANSNGDEENTELFGQVTAIGMVGALVGAAFGVPAQARLRQTAYDYNFGYEKKQRLAIPPLSPTLLNPNPPKGYKEPEKKESAPTRKKATSGKDVVPETASSSKVNKNRSDYGRKISGKYKGTGSLLEGKSVEEKYPEIYVEIERIDKTHVSIRIIESEEDYFDSPLVYLIKTNKNGGYTLSIDKLPEAVIQIAKNGKLTFRHRKVNIDNRIYTLEISAERYDQDK